MSDNRNPPPGRNPRPEPEGSEPTRAASWWTEPNAAQAEYLTPDETAPLVWEPEFSLGQLYNKGLFLLGYAPEMRYFCECVLENRPPEVGSLTDALEMLRVFEAYCCPDGERVAITP